ncbi:hypothetical protein GW758_04145 [Candidatus Falkowbacteria bacterium]|nr:hypothetical protein [Candidatus Falkowbacteria bacterium]
MKNKKLMNTVIALSALALIGGGIIASQAASDNMFEASNGKAMRGEARGFENLSEEERVVMEAQRESRQAEMQADFEAVEVALAANDYNAWKDAIGENNPFAEKVTADNFTKFVEAHNLMDDAREILKSIGIEEGPAMGLGTRQGNGQGNGQAMRRGNAQGERMMNNCPNLVNVETEIE